MLWIIIGALGAMFLLAITWYGLQTSLVEIIGALESAFPTEMVGDPGMTFASTIIAFFTAIAFFGILNWVYVQSQKPPGARR